MPDSDFICIACDVALQPGEQVCLLEECEHFRHANCTAPPICPVDGQHFDLRNASEISPTPFSSDFSSRLDRLRENRRRVHNCRNIAWILAHERSNTKDAVDWLRKAVRKNPPSVTALLDLAERLENGDGVVSDVNEAEAMRKRAIPLLEDLRSRNAEFLPQEERDAAIEEQGEGERKQESPEVTHKPSNEVRVSENAPSSDAKLSALESLLPGDDRVTSQPVVLEPSPPSSSLNAKEGDSCTENQPSVKDEAQCIGSSVGGNPSYVEPIVALDIQKSSIDDAHELLAPPAELSPPQQRCESKAEVSTDSPLPQHMCAAEAVDVRNSELTVASDTPDAGVEDGQRDDPDDMHSLAFEVPPMVSSSPPQSKPARISTHLPPPETTSISVVEGTASVEHRCEGEHQQTQVHLDGNASADAAPSRWTPGDYWELSEGSHFEENCNVPTPSIPLHSGVTTPTTNLPSYLAPPSQPTEPNVMLGSSSIDVGNVPIKNIPRIETGSTSIATGTLRSSAETPAAYLPSYSTPITPQSIHTEPNMTLGCSTNDVGKGPASNIPSFESGATSTAVPPENLYTGHDADTASYTTIDSRYSWSKYDVPSSSAQGNRRFRTGTSGSNNGTYGRKPLTSNTESGSGMFQADYGKPPQMSGTPSEAKLLLPAAGAFKDMFGRVVGVEAGTVRDYRAGADRLRRLKEVLNDLQARRESYWHRQTANAVAAAPIAVVSFGVSTLVQGPAAVHQRNRLEQIKGCMRDIIWQINQLRNAFAEYKNLPEWESAENSVVIKEKVFGRRSGIKRRELEGNL